jgi:isopentenyl-diphosphate delta-isomerase
MGDKKRFTSGRKLDHLRICIESDVEQGDAGFSDVRLLHEALPDCDMSKIRTNVRFLGHEFSSPLFIAAMTGGHPETREVNRTLARAARQFGIGMGVGSQRAALEHPELEDTYSVVREEAPESFIVANLGIVQLRDHGTEWAERAVEMIDADALAIHLNFLQEALQPEGDHNAAGCFAALADLCSGFSTPVIVKETGSGISAATARRCFGIGCAAIDVGGSGGTSWQAIEGVRARESQKKEHSGLVSIGETFRGWGIPTAVSICEVNRAGGPVIATGGVRSGLDMARAVVLGADLCGMALPLLKPALEGEESLNKTIEAFLQELRVAMFLTGSGTLADLRTTRATITGVTREMLESISEEYHGY